MTTRDIRPSDTFTVCDVCGRTLLRGERAEVFLAGSSRRSVCELCKLRALHEGWVREGAVPDFAAGEGPADRRRPLLRRRRRRRDGTSAPTLDDALSSDGWPAEPDAAQESRRRRRGIAFSPVPAPARAPAPREPRHVHAVPTSPDHRIAAALEAFNASEHPRTVAGVARSLGAPTVAAVPDPAHPTVVRITVAWELCWYRYDVDLSGGVRLDAQGYDLAELSDAERTPAAVADEAGRLLVA
jgi:hypothetical protein